MRRILKPLSVLVVLVLMGAAAWISFSPASKGLGTLAAETRQAILAGQYAKASGIITRVAEQSRTNGDLYYPYEDFISSIVPQNDPAFVEALERWTKEEPEAATPYLLLAEHYEVTAKRIRGNGWAQELPEDAWAPFHEAAAMTLRNLEQAEQRDPTNPSISHAMLSMALYSGSAVHTEEWKAHYFTAAIQKHPDFYPIYVARFFQFFPRWGGSHAQMEAFVAEHTQNLSPESLRHLLPLALVQEKMRDLPKEASVSPEGEATPSVDAFVDSPEVTAAIADMLSLHASLEPTWFNQVFIRVFSSIVNNEQPELAKKILAQAAPVIGTDSYAYLYAQARILGNTNGERRLKYYQQALAKIEATDFPSRQQQSLAMSNVLFQLASLLSWMERYDDAIAYGERSLAYDDIWGGSNLVLCRNYFDKGSETGDQAFFEKAIASCTRGIEIGDAAVWRDQRARAYLALGQPNLALKDALAGLALWPDKTTEVSLRNTVAVSYYSTSRLPEAVRVFSDYPFMLDESARTPRELDDAYAILCLALVDMNRREEALSACGKTNHPQAQGKLRQLAQ